MCPKPPKPVEIAAAPPPPLEPPDVTQIGQAREEENKKNFGNTRGPSMRARGDVKQSVPQVKKPTPGA